MPKNVYADETGFRFPTTCQTDGNSCDNMRNEDNIYNSWIQKGYEEIKTTFTDFGVPLDAVIDEIQIKLKIRVSGPENFWLVRFSDDGENTWYSPNYCTNISPSSCKYTAHSIFNSISSPTFTWLNTNKTKTVTGELLNEPNFIIKLSENNLLQNTDIDTLLFNIKYHAPNPAPTLPPGVTPYLITPGFTALPGYRRGVFFNDSVTFSNFQTGDKIILSSKPDGTGDIQVNDALQVDGTFSHFYFDANPLCIPSIIGSLPPTDFTTHLSVSYPDLSISIWDNCLINKTIGPIYLVHIKPAPAPFLDLPWDYQAKGLSFNEAALAINSYFDHEYPLLSSGLDEPIESSQGITNYKNKKSQDSYTAHDGYDYGIPAKVHIGDNVLATAEGMATYSRNDISGNMIEIDHGNGYQTRYMHLQPDGLITNIPNNPVHIVSRQIIGKVGSTGNSTGAHIHFGVFQDKNHDGNFEDNVPDGVTDPFGWQSTDPDPWENYSFMYAGQQRTGNKSYYLWKNKLDSLDTTLTSNGGTFSTGKYTMGFPQNSVTQNISIKILSEPITKISNLISSIGTTILATAKDSLGNPITQFLNPFTLTVDFAQSDLSNINPTSLSIFSSIDGINWIKENTTLDLINKKATSSINHFTHFALFGEKLDIIAPTTTAVLLGTQGETNWFRSDVQVSLSASDSGGLGVDYTVYKINDGDWQQYAAPFSFTNGGHYKVDYYSVDKGGNIEDVKFFEFDIDKTPPVLNSSTTSEGNPYAGAWTNKDVLVSFSCEDNQSGVLSLTQPVLVSTEEKNQKVTGECADKAGNKTTTEITGINIDKTNPEAEIKYNIDTQDLEITGKDISTVDVTKSSLSKNTEQILLVDKVGYSLKIIAEKKRKAEKKETEIDFVIKEIKYNDTPSLKLEKNQLSIQDEKEHFKKDLEQSFSIKGELKIKMEYDSKKNETRIITKVKGEEKVKEKLSGIRILKLTTEKGTLKYSYQ